MIIKHGERVFAVLSATTEEVALLGFGVYVGDEVPPEPMGVVRSIFQATTWEEFDRVVAQDTGQATDPAVRPPNPKLVLDDGSVVWGPECWWGSEEAYPKFLGTRSERRCMTAAAREAVAAQQAAINKQQELS